MGFFVSATTDGVLHRRGRSLGDASEILFLATQPARSRACYWSLDEGSLIQLHASAFHLPTWLLVRTESLLEREGALFLAERNHRQVPSDWWFRRSGSANQLELFCRNHARRVPTHHLTPIEREGCPESMKQRCTAAVRIYLPVSH